MVKKIVAGMVVGILVIFGMTKLKSRWPEPSLGVICQNKPKFEDFSESLSSDRLSRIDVDSNTMAREEMKSELLSATGSAVNFAGIYVLVSHNCGDKCQKYAIVEPKEGKILFFGLQSTGGVVFQTNSRLIMTNLTNKNRSIYYEFRDSKLNYLCEEEKKQSEVGL